MLSVKWEVALIARVRSPTMPSFVQMGVTKDVYKVAGGGLIGEVKEILNDANVKRIVVKDDKGKVLLSIPVTCGRCNNGGISTMAGCARSYRRNSHPVYYRG